MKSTLRTIISSVYLIVGSFSAPFVVSFFILAISDSLYMLRLRYDLSVGELVLLVGIILAAAAYVGALIASAVWLCRRLYQVKKTLVGLPVIAAVVSFLLNFFFIYLHFQWE